MERKSKKKNRLSLLENFLRNAEKESGAFTKQELVDYTGYPLTTISTYFTKYLINEYIFPKTSSKFISKGIQLLSSDEFNTLMSQNKRRNSLNDSRIDPKVEKLRQRSVDSFCLAVENFNRITLPNRVEVFCILMTHAWELLLKSVIISTAGLQSIYYKNTKNTLSLNDTLPKCFDDNNPIKKNIETLSELRHQAIHFLIEDLNSQLTRVFQASVLNFNEYYLEKVGKKALPKNKIGLLSLVYDSGDFENEVHLKESLIDPEFTQAFIAKLADEEKSIQSEKYAISIERKLVLTKKESEADITLSTQSDSQHALIIERPVSREKTHPFKQNAAINAINERILVDTNKLNQYSFQALIYKHSVKKDKSLFAEGEFKTPGSYSQKLVEKLVVMINSNPDCIKSAKEHYKNRPKSN